MLTLSRPLSIAFLSSALLFPATGEHASAPPDIALAMALFETLTVTATGGAQTLYRGASDESAHQGAEFRLVE